MAKHEFPKLYANNNRIDNIKSFIGTNFIKKPKYIIQGEIDYRRKKSIKIKMNDKKKILIIIAIILIIAIIIGIIVAKSTSKNEEKANSSKTTKADFLDVFELEEIEKSDYNIQKAKNLKIAEKYIVGSNTFQLNESVQFEEIEGKMIFVRDSYNKVNIFQTQYRIDIIDNISLQVGKYMDSFRQECLKYIGTNKEPYIENLYGESTEKTEIPLAESIFNENRLYSLTYKVDDKEILEEMTEVEEKNKIKNVAESKEYDINFYRSGEYLVCEFARIF